MSNSESQPLPSSLPAILLVDDESGLAELVRLALSGRFKVHVTTSPEIALMVGEDPDIRLLLTDLSMDEMNGIELIQRIRARRPDLPCVLFSGNLTRASWAAAFNAGCRHVLAKPLALRVIIDLCTALISPPPEAVVPEHSRDTLESIAWEGTLGENLRLLVDHLLAGASPIILHTPGGPFPPDLLLGLIPSLQNYPRADAPPPPHPLFTDLQGLTLPEQNRLAQLLPSRREFPWLLSSDKTPYELLATGLLADGLHVALSAPRVHLPAPGDCPADTVRICDWWLAGPARDSSLTPEARRWLTEQVRTWDWSTLFLLLREAAAQNPTRPLETAHFQHASLSISLGADLGTIQRYPDFADNYTRQLRTAWEALAAVPVA